MVRMRRYVFPGLLHEASTVGGIGNQVTEFVSILVTMFK